MIRIEPITRQNALVFKAIRLRALQDAPFAFGSTFRKESQLTDSDWINRVERMNGEVGAGSWQWMMILRVASSVHSWIRAIGRALT